MNNPEPLTALAKFKQDVHDALHSGEPKSNQVIEGLIVEALVAYESCVDSEPVQRSADGIFADEVYAALTSDKKQDEVYAAIITSLRRHETSRVTDRDRVLTEILAAYNHIPAGNPTWFESQAAVGGVLDTIARGQMLLGQIAERAAAVAEAEKQLVGPN